MVYKSEDVIFETENYWVLRVKRWYEVYKIGTTCSTRCAQIGPVGCEKAIAEAEASHD